ncbi:hypothetical protein [Serratia ureilytica]|uniref:hypothetical protein n=1 Tax=Serratia ureilytica TaxID=300181 RepID=UPI00191F6765|nr:hypothetical protein [Serratia ureilytica]QQU63996.1 hypothetical protein I6I46_04165 [Serratia ureilytica]
MKQTLTTEQLRTRIGHLKERLRDMKQHKYPDNCPNATAYLESLKAERQQDITLLEELLANREAQPVLYASEETLAYAKEGEKSLVTWSDPMGDAVIPLFTFPKAQTSGVVNLPTEFISDEGVMVRLEQVMAALALVGVKYERRGDACRAAMLAQPVSQRYTLPPHVFRELVNSLRDTAVKFSGTEQLRERLNTALSQFIEPDHPHTRTVAPEGGNGA